MSKRGLNEVIALGVQNLHKGVSRSINRQLWSAVGAGEIVVPTECEVCGRILEATAKRGPKRMVRHHWDNARPYDVIWRCNSCHFRVSLALFELFTPKALRRTIERLQTPRFRDDFRSAQPVRDNHYYRKY